MGKGDLRRRPGRKPKPGKRQPNGARSEPKVEAIRQENTKAVVIAYRRKNHGLSKDDAERDLAGTAPGRLLLASLISKDEHDACERYAELMREASISGVGPKPARAAALEALGAAHIEPVVTLRDLRRQERLDQADALFRAKHPTVRKVVDRIVLDDADIRPGNVLWPAFSVGLRTLLQLWGLTNENRPDTNGKHDDLVRPKAG